ncbi:type II CAAX prenyl endopeptidase Rce1 family protein [Devosia sp.]|uniref:CPBP family glutamic-type intramembrane protease n=1 Tax=Devosia sp. TaxID=1871048 RepID=UPI0035B288E0
MTPASATRRPIVPLFLLLTFGWAWLLWGYWVVAMPPGGLVISPAFIVTALLGGFAPSLAALAVTYRQAGRRGLATLLQPLRDGRFAPSIYAMALLLVPAVALLSALLQSVLVGPLKWADPALLLMALLWPLMAALGEEIGWRGLLLPRLAARLGLLPAALVIGLIWGVWHLPADFVGLKGYGDWFWLAFLVNGPYVLTAHSIIMTWLWKRTGGSLLAAVLYHFSVTASAILAPTAGAEGPSGLAAAAIGATLLWLIAIALIVSRRRDFEQRRPEMTFQH